MVAFAAAIPAVVSAAKAAGSWLASNPAATSSIFGSLSNLAGGMFSAKGKQADMGSLYNQLLVNQRINQQNMDYQHNLNMQATKYQYDLEQEAQRNAYQNTVYSLEQAGLNPILAATNGATVPAVTANSVGGASSDMSGLMSSGASSAQAQIAKDQIKLNAMQTFADVAMKMTSSALTAEKTKTEKFIQDLDKSQLELNFLEKVKEEIKNMYLPKQIETDMKYKLDSAKASLIQAQVAQMVAPSIISSNYTNSAANWKNAEANYINASEGSPTKVIVDTFKGLGVSPSGAGKYIRNSFAEDWKRMTGHSGPSDFDKKVYNYLEKRYYNYFKDKFKK